MLTEKDYCDYETSRELKELGFIAGLGEDNCGHCLYDDAWHDQVDRPLLYEAQKWLREEKEIAVFAIYDKNTSKWFATVINMDSLETTNTVRYDLYEEALSEGVREAIKILKEDDTLEIQSN